jgi:3-methyladenine DNA glycosylase AlkD
VIADEVQAILMPLGTAERATREKAYMKSSLKFLGVAVPDIRREAKAYARINKPKNADELIYQANGLWASGVYELRSFAIALLGLHSKILDANHLDWLKGLIVDASCWGHVDWLSTEALSEIVHRDQQAMNQMDAWAEDPCFWVQRAAMLSLLIPLRRGNLTEWSRFCGYSVPLLKEKEFFIRKAIGWVLRETSKKSPDVVRNFIEEHKAGMSGLTLREAEKYL